MYIKTKQKYLRQTKCLFLQTSKSGIKSETVIFNHKLHKAILYLQFFFAVSTSSTYLVGRLANIFCSYKNKSPTGHSTSESSAMSIYRITNKMTRDLFLIKHLYTDKPSKDPTRQLLYRLSQTCIQQSN